MKKITQWTTCKNLDGEEIDVPHCPECGVVLSFIQYGDVKHHFTIEINDVNVAMIGDDIYSHETPNLWWRWSCDNCDFETKRKRRYPPSEYIT